VALICPCHMSRKSSVWCLCWCILALQAHIGILNYYYLPQRTAMSSGKLQLRRGSYKCTLCASRLSARRTRILGLYKAVRTATPCSAYQKVACILDSGSLRTEVPSHSSAMGHYSTMEWPLHVRFIRTITYPVTQLLFVVTIKPSASFTAEYLLENKFHTADMSNS
jgi:hypothetical protein